MKLTKILPILYTANMKETIDYYVQTLGFRCHSFDTQSGWASLRCDEIEIMLSIPNKNLPFDAPVFTGSVYIHTDDVEQLWARFKDKTTVCYPLETFGYGMREFGIYDNNGYLLQFGQSLKESKH